MCNVQKFYKLIFVVIIISCTVATETISMVNGDETQLRVRRHNKKSESTSESVEKQKPQEHLEDSEGINRPQSARIRYYAANTPSDLTPIQENVKNLPTQARQLPYQDYIMQILASAPYQEYLTNIPNTAAQTFQQSFINFIPQQPIMNLLDNLQPVFNGNLPNLGDYGIMLPGLQQVGQYGQSILPAVFNNNLVNTAAIPNGQMNVIPIAPLSYPLGEQHPNTLTPPVYPNVNSFLQHVNSISQPSQLRQFSTFAHFGVPHINGIRNELSAPAGLLPDFVRNQRSLANYNEK